MMDERTEKFIADMEAMIDEVLTNTLKGENMDSSPQPVQVSMKEWLETNTDGPNGERLKRFRRTKNQMERGLTKDEAFSEYILNRNKN